jgi:hypothetical protein
MVRIGKNTTVVIREQQMEAFRRARSAAFEDEMVAHSRDFSPRLCEVIGEEQLRVALRRAIDRADRYGLTCRGPIRLFIELMFLFGSGFDADAQYPWAREILHGSGDEMQRAQQLYERTLDYQEKVSGRDGENTRRALMELSILARHPETFLSSDIVARLRREMTRVFPEKAAYIGEDALTTLIKEGRAEAQKYLFPTVRGEALVVSLMFAFGHGCTDDPLYPWIARTLCDNRIIDPVARAERLEKKAVTWLEHALATLREGAQT